MTNPERGPMQQRPLTETVQCKFLVNQITESRHHMSYHLGAVYSNDPNHPNHKFWEATPNGELTITVSKEKIPGRILQLGSEYFLDLTLADEGMTT